MMASFFFYTFKETRNATKLKSENVTFNNRFNGKYEKHIKMQNETLKSN